MVRAAVEMGNFVSTVTSGKWWRIKKRYLRLSMDKGYSIKKRRELDNVVVRPSVAPLLWPSVGVKPNTW
jgi:hypothetical protein